MTAVEFKYNLVNLQEHLMKFAYSLTSNEDDAKDLVQETFFKALKYSDTFVREINFKGWIFAIMRNTYINEYRRSFRYIVLNEYSKSDPAWKEIKGNGSDDPLSVFSSKELEHMINSLNDDLKLPFKMHYDGYKYKEIAELLNTNIGTIKHRIFIARRKMIKQLD